MGNKEIKSLELPTYNLTHTRPIVGYGNFTYDISKSTECMVDPTVVDKKFELWDYVIQNNLLESEDQTIRDKALSLLKDKTIFLYNFMRLNGKPVKTRWTQDIVLSDNSDRVEFCACNQHLGKSTSLDFDASTEFLFDHGRRWVGLLVSGSLSQSQERMRNIKQLLDSMDGVDYKMKDIDIDAKGQSNATQISIYFYDEKTKKPLYSNLLICCPHTSSALGYPADNIWLDEVDFWEDVKGGQIHFLNQVLIPRTFFTKGKIKAYSNPNGKDRMMYYLWLQTNEEGNPAWHRYHFNYWDKPNPTQKEFNKSIIGFTKNEIESTLLAAFTTTEGSFFSSQEIKDMSDPELSQKGDTAGYGKETAWFLDVGSVHDQSVLIGGYAEDNPLVPEIPLLKAHWIHKYPVGYPIARVIGVDSAIEEDDGWDDYVDDNPSVKEVLFQYAEPVESSVNGKIIEKKFQPLFGFDATGNAGLAPLFVSAEIEAVDVTFTGKLKWHMYQRYQYYVQQRFLKRAKERDHNTVRGSDFDYQASKLIVKKNTHTVYRQIHHEKEDDLDDTQDAMAGFILLRDPLSVSSYNFEIISHTPEGEEKEQISEDQYIPSFMDKGELNSWIEQKESQLR